MNKWIFNINGVSSINSYYTPFHQTQIRRNVMHVWNSNVILLVILVIINNVSFPTIKRKQRMDVWYNY